MTSLLDNAGKAIALAATTCLCLSVLYDWGYFFAFGLTFAEVPTTISDHVRSALVWLPESTILLAGWAAVAPWPEFSVPSSLTIAAHRDTEPNEVERSRPQLLRFVGVSTVAAWIGAFLIGDRWLAAYAFAAILSWGFLFARARSHPGLRERLPQETWRAILWFPIVAIVIFSFGHADAHFALQAKFSPAKVYVQSAAPDSPLELQVFRQFEKFLLVRDKNNNVVLFKPDQITKVEDMAKPLRIPGILCLQFGVACSK
ncbi:MAG: hypothetical protein PHY45_16925 [Rhodocyclaceae bacterium]|nr:hypothetical protein [Rhodocyclaceae bacterium]